VLLAAWVDGRRLGFDESRSNQIQGRAQWTTLSKMGGKHQVRRLLSRIAGNDDAALERDAIDQDNITAAASHSASITVPMASTVGFVAVAPAVALKLHIV
jgi:hypothetical protein